MSILPSPPVWANPSLLQPPPAPSYLLFPSTASHHYKAVQVLSVDPLILLFSMKKYLRVKVYDKPLLNSNFSVVLIRIKTF